jgi:ABC-type nitrate/sulfonate/bicarbonate transport system substrate-binding protein
MRRSRIIILLLILILLACMVAHYIDQRTTIVSTPGKEIKILYAGGVGLMPMLLATEQIDGYVAWQPYLAIGEESGIGKLVCPSQDFPPLGMWKDHPCCVLVARDDLIADHPDLVSSISLLTIYGTQYITENPNRSSEIAADWLMGGGNYTFGNGSVSSTEIIEKSRQTLKFTTGPTKDWLEAANLFVDAQVDVMSVKEELNLSDIFNFRPYENALKMYNSENITTPGRVDKQLGLGYLMSDHHTPLFVAVKDWQYFNKTYGIALKPQDEKAIRPEVVDFIINGEKIAEFKLISASDGPPLMTLMEENCIHMAYVGITPPIGAISLGAKIKILHPIQNEGSGLIVPTRSPANDWNSFVLWAMERSSGGRPLIIADPDLGSIQDVMLKEALEDSGFTVVIAS